MGETMPTMVRMPVDLVRRVDDHLDRMRAQLVGYKLTRSDVIRALLSKALDAEEPKRERPRAVASVPLEHPLDWPAE